MSMADKREPIAGTSTQANHIYQADSRTLDMIEDGVVDLVICSPPYNVGKNYKNHDDARRHEDHLKVLRDASVGRGGTARRWGRAPRPALH